jgi:hypothetical protein
LNLNKEKDMTDEAEVQVDQHGSAVPEGFSEAYDSVMTESADDTVEADVETVDEDTTEVETDEEIVEEVEETEEAEVEETAEAEETEVEAEEPEPKKEPAEAKQPEVKAEEVEEINFELDEDLVDPSVKTALDKIAGELNEQKKSIAKREEALRLEREQAFENRIDSCFDKFNGDLPALGSTKSLTEDNGKYRRRLFQMAQVTANLDGVSMEEAIQDTVQMFKNRDGETKAEKALISKLNKQKKTFTNSPTRKKKSIADRKFKSEAEKARAVMDKAYVDAGIE